jgi:hypothetical protein
MKTGTWIIVASLVLFAISLLLMSALAEGQFGR